jgi:hypothetical protein
MTDRPSIEQDINDIKRTIGQIDKDVKQLRDWISSNERALAGMPETLRRITEEGMAKARADLAQRENELQRLRGELAQNEKVLHILNSIERKRQDIATLEREQEQIVVLLERHRTELRQLQLAYDEHMRPQTLPPCELVLPNNQRVPLDAAKGEYLIRKCAVVLSLCHEDHAAMRRSTSCSIRSKACALFIRSTSGTRQ